MYIPRFQLILNSLFLNLAGTCLLLGIVTSTVFAQKYSLAEVITVEDGLPFRHVNSIGQDKYGLMWIGTNTGICRFDGTSFIKFDPISSGNGYSNGGFVFNSDSTFLAVSNTQDFIQMNINTFESENFNNLKTRIINIVKGKDGDIWIITNSNSTQKIIKYSQESFSEINVETGSSADFLDIDTDTFGNVWYSNSTKGLQQFSQGGELLSEVKLDSFLWQGHKTMFFNDFIISSQNEIYYYSKNDPKSYSIWVYNPITGSKKKVIDNLTNEFFNAFEDSMGNLWFAIEKGLLKLNKDGSVDDFSSTLNNALDFSFINCFFEDDNKLLWIGSDGGIFKIPSKANNFQKVFNNRNSNWGNSIRGIVNIGNDKNFFYCNYGDIGFYITSENNSKIQKIEFENVIPDLFDSKYYVYDSLRNCVWAKGENLLKINLSNWNIEKVHFFEDVNNHTQYNPLVMNSMGDLITGNDLNHLYLYDIERDSIRNLVIEPVKENENLNPISILQVSHDSLWIGTQNGLYLINSKGERIASYLNSANTEKSVLSIMDVKYDAERNCLWLSTLGKGLKKLDLNNSKITTYNTSNGLPDNNVVSVLLDENNNLWVATYNGLSYFNSEFETFTNYFIEDGLTHNEFNFSSFFQSDDGRLYFGGMNGINIFLPDDILVDQKDQLMKLVSFSKYNMTDDSLEVIRDHHSLSGVFEINYDINYFQFDWTLSNYYRSNKNQYSYWMEGLDEGWIENGNSTTLKFNKLPIGDYQLHIKGKDSKGNMSIIPETINILVLAPWWRQWWAYLSYFFLLGIVIYILSIRELKRIRVSNQLDKEQLELKRLKELDEVKSNFITNISHEFRTPLTVILGMADEIKSQETLKKTITQSGKNLLQLVNQMLDLGKLETGKLLVNKKNGDIVLFIKYLLDSIESLASGKKIDLKFVSQFTNLQMSYDEVKIQHIILNLLSNAIKFTHEGGEVKLKIGLENLDTLDSKLVIQVIDNGVGIPQEDLKNIFDRFFQSENLISAGSPGTGVGLSFAKELINLLGGTIQVASQVNKGSKFTVLLPVSNYDTSAIEITNLDIDKATVVIKPDVENNILKPTGELNSELPLLLIIEDNYEVTIYLKSILESKYEVVVANDGQKGINKALDLIPDLIISDVMMPYKNGFEVTEILKNDVRTSHIPIVLLTAKADEQSEKMGYQRKADVYLMKPFEKDVLFLRLENLLNLRNKVQSFYSKPHILAQASKTQSNKIEISFFDKLNLFIENNLSNPELNVHLISSHMNMSRSQLYRKLSALTGKSIIVYIKDLRLNASKRLLSRSESSISEIAYAIGFTDPSYFTRVFTKHQGESPREYRRKNKI